MTDTNLNGYESDFYGNKFTWFYAYVDEVHLAEKNRKADTLLRVAIRIVGMHDEAAPISDLPLAVVLMPNTGADVFDIGETVGLEVGSFVVGFWMDRHRQHPCIIGTLPGITPPPVSGSSDVSSAVSFNQATTGPGADTSVEEVLGDAALGGPTV